MTGGLYVDPAIANLVFDAKSKRSQHQTSYGNGLPLTEREAEVLKLVALGFTNKEVARKLNVGIKSVETYRVRGSEKLGLRFARARALRLRTRLAGGRVTFLLIKRYWTARLRAAETRFTLLRRPDIAMLIEGTRFIRGFPVERD